MQLKQLVATGAFALAALAATPAAAQNCAGFVDMPLSDPNVAAFCSSVEWMKNRGITTGCANPVGGYCPETLVTRLQMAGFMKRLGDKLTPEFLRKREPAGGGSVLLSFPLLPAAQILCATDAPPPLDPAPTYPRSAIVRGLVNLFTPDGSMDIKAWVVYSTDGGPFVAPATNDGVAYAAIYTGLAPPNDVSLHPMTVIDLNAGSKYRFALAVAKTGAGIGGSQAQTYCENLVQIFSRTGTSTPFDAAVENGVHGRGD